MKNFFEIGVKWCYSVTKLNYIVISTFLERNLVTVGVLQGVTKSLDLLKIFFLNKNTFIIKNGTNEKKKVTI